MRAWGLSVLSLCLAIGCGGDDNPACETIGINETDQRLKYGLDFDRVIKDVVNPKVPVHYMPESDDITIPLPGLAHAHGNAAIGKDVIYWPIYNGTLYMLDAKKGSYLHQVHCRRGAMYGGPSVVGERVAVGCGEEFQGGEFSGEETGGDTVEVFGLPKKGKKGKKD